MICIFCSRRLAIRKTCRNNIGQVAAAQLCESGQYAATAALVTRTMREMALAVTAEMGAEMRSSEPTKCPPHEAVLHAWNPKFSLRDGVATIFRWLGVIETIVVPEVKGRKLP